LTIEGEVMLVGITGKAGAGKDTVGDYLIENYGLEKDSMAAPLKRFVQDVFSVDDFTMHDREEREKTLEAWGDRSVRQWLQYIGTDVCRKKIDDAIWVKSLWMRIKPRIDEGHDFVITDIRFPNELNYLKDNSSQKRTGRLQRKDFVSIKVVREGFDGSVGLESLPHYKKLLAKILHIDFRHPSERYDLDTDYIIENNGDFEELYAKIDALAETIGLEKTSHFTR
jgi:hypothetical protein